MNLKQTFKKQGGFKLLKQYWQSGALFTACTEFLLLGKSRTALEILRLSASLKTKQKLEKKYKKELIAFDKSYDESLPHESSDKVWICWLQGMENAPEIVKKCYESIRKNMPDKDIIVITDDNIFDYVEFPDFIVDKWKRGIISNAHFSDLLRLELLIKYGGTWIDATVYCSGSDIPSYMVESDLFLFQCLKPGRDGHCNYVSSWFMSAKTNNKVLMAVRQLCYTYWTEHNSMVDYFLLHSFISIVFDFYPEEWKKIIPRDNATPHNLLLRLFDQYDEQMWNAIVSQTPFHKLTYKFEEEKTELGGTYYKIVMAN